MKEYFVWLDLKARFGLQFMRFQIIQNNANFEKKEAVY
jgi:hypothetical protein